MIFLNALLSPNIGLMFWTILIFLLLLFLLGKFAWKPISDALRLREEGIKKALLAAEIAREELKELVAKNVELIIQGQTERDAIIKEAKERSEQIIEEAKESAKAEGKRILKEAKEIIEREKELAIKAVISEVSELVLQTSAKVIKKELSFKDEHLQLIESQIKELGY